MRRALTCLTVLFALMSFASAGGRVLGRLGQATGSAGIYAKPTSSARMYYRVKAYEYLVIRNYGSSKWFKVLLQNGTYGYINHGSVAQLPYEVTAKANTNQQAAPGNRYAMANYAMNFIGTPYEWGGNDETRGIDCSGFVKKMYGKIGLNLPRTAAQQANVGQSIYRYEDLQPGDRLYFWESKRGKIGHTGIYLGNGYFVHSSVGHGGVATDYLSKKWQKILVAAKR